jgi:hypothetical protein
MHVSIDSACIVLLHALYCCCIETAWHIALMRSVDGPSMHACVHLWASLAATMVDCILQQCRPAQLCDCIN